MSSVSSWAEHRLVLPRISYVRHASGTPLGVLARSEQNRRLWALRVEEPAMPLLTLRDGARDRTGGGGLASRRGHPRRPLLTPPPEGRYAAVASVTSRTTASLGRGVTTCRRLTFPEEPHRQGSETALPTQRHRTENQFMPARQSDRSHSAVAHWLKCRLSQAI